MKSLCLFWLVAMVAAAGCTTLNQRRGSGNSATVQNDPPATKAEVARLQSRIEEMDAEIDHMRAEIERLRGESNQGDQDVRVRLDSLEQSVRSTSAAWDADKKELIRLIKVAAAGGGSGGTGSGGRNVERGYEHVVKTGETLIQIAKAYKVSTEKIKAANNLKDDRLKIGQKLFIPE